MEAIIERWKAIGQRIQTVQQESINTHPVTLIAVSKAHRAEAILPLLAAGQAVFGENRVQETVQKWPPLQERYPAAELHLIGSLQTNKVKEALSLYNAIHTIDRPKLVDAIIKEREKDEGIRCMQFFIQVNTAGEPQKGGVAVKEAARLFEYCCSLALPVTGLMCVPPANEPPAPHFTMLRDIAHEFRLPHLSMGMSGDYETAVRLGATHVRIGTALFGAR